MSDELGDDMAAAPRDRKKALIPVIIGIVVVLAIVALCGLLWFLTMDPARTANIRDIVIIMFAFVNVLIAVMLAVLVFQLQALIALLRNEVKPLLGEAQRTFTNVRGTTEFVSDRVAQPAIKIASFFARVGGMGSALRGKAARRKN